ncbi:MAG: MBL fold metallo-hydrolase [Pseudomonadota bacterium]
MKFHQLRNATCVLESGDVHILVDPMLSDRKALNSFTRRQRHGHRPARNPTVGLPANAADVLDKVTHCLITHSQKLGIDALRHSDHLDDPGAAFLAERQIPVLAPRRDVPFLKKLGLHVEAGLDAWQPHPAFGGEVTAVPATHGYGWVRFLMANGAGFVIRLPDEPSIYISGDTIYSKDVRRALRELKPDVAVMAAGSASLDVGGLLLMSIDDLVAFARDAPGRVVANHLEALNHCPTTRAQLRQVLEANGLAAKVFIPEDGETLTLANDA